MEISKTNIEFLYEFTRKHFVEYYDLQTELVDHLANGIENQWKENKNLSFEKALENEFKKFGVFGFQDVVEQRRKYLNKKYHLIIWEELKNYIKLPFILAVIISIYLLKLFLEKINYSEEVYMITLFSGFVLILINSVIKKTEINKLYRLNGKKWMFEEIIFTYGNISSLFIFFIQIATHFSLLFKTQIGLYFLSLLLIFIVLAIYTIVIQIPKNAKDYLHKTYPEYLLFQD